MKTCRKNIVKEKKNQSFKGPSFLIGSYFKYHFWPVFRYLGALYKNEDSLLWSK